MAENKVMHKPVSPCKDCQKREVGCHSRCFAYIFFKARLRRFKQEESNYWHRCGYDPAVGDRNRHLRDVFRKKRS